MRSVKKLDRETIIEFLAGKHGYDREVLSNFCSDAWLVDIAERQLFVNPDEEIEQPTDEPDPRVLDVPKAWLRCEIEKAIKEFLENGGEIEVVPAVHQEVPGEAGNIWAKEIWADE
jgi:hypothetical protein